MRATRTVAVFFVTAGLIAGCGGTPEGDVSGTVIYDGKPIEQGSISFIPADGNGPSAGGGIKDGKYSASKVPVGMAKIKITGAKVTSKKKMYDDPSSDWVMTSTEMLPTKYNDKTELLYDVRPGSQQKDFDLSK